MFKCSVEIGIDKKVEGFFDVVRYRDYRCDYILMWRVVILVSIFFFMECKLKKGNKYNGGFL